MGDAAILTQLGVPTVALITDRFWAQSDMVAAARGVPTLPRVLLPYPVAGTGAENLRAQARAATPEIAKSLGLTP